MLNLEDLELFVDLSEDDGSKITGGHRYVLMVCSRFDLDIGTEDPPCRIWREHEIVEHTHFSDGW